MPAQDVLLRGSGTRHRERSMLQSRKLKRVRELFFFLRVTVVMVSLHGDPPVLGQMAIIKEARVAGTVFKTYCIV